MSEWVDALNRIVQAGISKVRTLELDWLRPFGRGKLIIGHPDAGNKVIEVKQDGITYNGNEIGTGSGATQFTEYATAFAGRNGSLTSYPSLGPVGSTGTMNSLTATKRINGLNDELWLNSGGGSTSDVNVILGSGVIQTEGAYLDMDNHKITSVSTPTANTDAANKKYVDDEIAGSGHISKLSDDGTPELSWNLNVNNYDLLYCNVMKFYDSTGNNMIGTGSSGQVMAMAGANGSVIGYGSGGTVYSVLKASSTGVDVYDDIAMNNHKITSLIDPTNDQDAATKKYVDANAGGDVVDDLSPQLGGDLDCNGKDITKVTEISGTGSGNVVFTCDDGYAFVFRKVAL